MIFPEVQIVSLTTAVDASIVQLTPAQQTIEVEAYKTKIASSTTTRARIGE